MDLNRNVSEILLSVVALTFCLTTLSAAQVDNDEAARQSTFIFRGTITHLRSTTMPEVAASGNTIVVKVEEVMQAPPFLSNAVGKEITIYTPNPEGTSIGGEAIFFTRGWMIGDGIAVQEISRQDARISSVAPTRVAAASQTARNQELLERIKGADLVIFGRVTSVRPSPDQIQLITEHDPQWQEAVVEISETLRGSSPQKSVRVLYPGSQDVMWVGVPRFKPGQEGILVLRRWQKTEAYTALDPLDFQPRDQLDRIKGLIRLGASPKKK